MYWYTFSDKKYVIYGISTLFLNLVKAYTIMMKHSASLWGNMDGERQINKDHNKKGDQGMSTFDQMLHETNKKFIKNCLQQAKLEWIFQTFPENIQDSIRQWLTKESIHVNTFAPQSSLYIMFGSLLWLESLGYDIEKYTNGCPNSAFYMEFYRTYHFLASQDNVQYLDEDKRNKAIQAQKYIEQWFKQKSNMLDEDIGRKFKILQENTRSAVMWTIQ